MIKIFKFMKKKMIARLKHGKSMIYAGRVNRIMALAGVFVLIMASVYAKDTHLDAPLFLHGMGQQEKQLSGTVHDRNGAPVAGASVSVPGTERGTITDSNGSFKLLVPAGTATIHVSFVGMEQVSVSVINTTQVTVVLEPGAVDMDEVVVIGYGSQSRRNVSAAITSIQADEIKNMGVTGIDKAIQGKAPGVTVVNNSGEPGSGVNIRIRGTASIGSGNDPLYVIDGIPIENTQTSNVNVGQNRVNGMSHINPADIESIQILKDAAATSIYGARAANGVVLITTKRGIAGRSELTVDYYTGWSNETNQYNLLGASDYARLVNEGRAQLAATAPEYSPYFSQSFIDNPTVDVDWQDQIFRTASVNEINASMRGGTERTKYMFSSGFLNQEGIIIGTDFRRFNMRANLDQNLGKRVTVGTSLYAAFTDQARAKNDGSPIAGNAGNNNHIYGTSVLSTALVKSPATPVYLANGTFSNDPDQRDYGNPVRQAIGVGIGNDVTRIIASAYGKVEILPGLSFRSQLSGDIRSELETWYDPPQPNPYPGTDFRGQSSQRTFNQRVWYFENYFNYSLGVSDHQFDVVLGNTLQETKAENSFLLVSGIESDKIKTLNGGTDIDIGTSGRQSYGIVSYFGRLNYDFKGKYLFLLNARYDGSSRFGKDNRYGFFPSASIGWRISDEPFLQSATFLDDWKIRASYGLTGNQEIGNYVARGVLVVGTGTNQGNNYNNQMGGTISTLPSPDLKWEETAQFNVGMDMALFGNRLGIAADYYVKTTRDLLFSVPLPGSRGVSSKLENLGKIENRGVELALNGVLLSKNRFSWRADFNVASNANKVLELLNGNDVISSNSIAREGESINFLLYEREKFVDPATGFIKFIDHNENGARDDDDRILAGSPFPKYFGGLTNDLSYNGFDLSVFFQFSYGNKIYNQTRAFLERLDLLTANPTSIIGPNVTRDAYEGRWKKAGDETHYPGVNYRGDDPTFNLPHTGWLEDGSYLRLKSLTIGYSLPGTWLTKAWLRSVRVYATANNLLTFTKYKGFDPEVDHFTGGGIAVGYDNGTYPQAKLYRFGVNFTL